MDPITAKTTPEPSVKWAINEPEYDISFDSREASPKKRMSQVDKTKLSARPRSGSPAVSGKFKLDYSSDINKLKNTKDGEEQAVLEAKKLRNEIEEQMEISFDLIEERQNEVKDYLHRRELEEEEHKKRAADIVKKLQNGMMDIEEGIGKRVKDKPKDKRSEDWKDETAENENVKIEKDDKSSQTDQIILNSESIQVNPEDFQDDSKSFKELASNQQLGIDDIPDVIEAIKDDLVEKMKMKLADEEDNMERKKKLTAPGGQRQGEGGQRQGEIPDLRSNRNKVEGDAEMGQFDAGRIDECDGPRHTKNGIIPHCEISTNDHGEQTIFDEALNKKLDQLAESIISNEMKNDKLSEEMKDMINDNKEEMKGGLLLNVSDVNEIPETDEEAKESLKDVYQKMKTVFDELGNLIVGQDTKEKEIGMERLVRCRGVCRELDQVEDEIKEINDEIVKISRMNNEKGDRASDLNGARTDSSDQSNNNEINKSIEDIEDVSRLGDSKGDQNADSSDHLNCIELNDAGRLRKADATASMLPQVARLRSYDDEMIDNKMYANKDIPAVTDENKQLAGLLNQRIEALKLLDSKLNELQTMLGQQQLQGAMEGTDLPSKKGLELDKMRYDDRDLKESEARLKGVNLDLQKELDAVYNTNKSLAEENKKLMKNLEEMGEHKEDKLSNYLIYNDLDIPRWENEHRMRDQLKNIQNKIGDELFKMLVEDSVVDKLSLGDLEAPEVIVLENGNLDQIMKDYSEDLEKLSERFINADVSNDLQEITKIKNPDTNRVTENLKCEIENFEKLLQESEGMLEQDERELNNLFKERNEELKEIQKLQGEKRDLHKMLAETNSLIYKQFPATMHNNDVDAVNTRLQEIDNEVDMIGKELQSQRKREFNDPQDDAPLKNVEQLRELLKKLEPHVNKEVKEFLFEDEQQIQNLAIPDEEQVDEIIDLKEGIDNEIWRNKHEKAKLQKEYFEEREERSEEDREEIDEGDNKGSLQMDETESQEEDRDVKLRELKKQLRFINEEMEKMDITPEDVKYLEEIIASLENSIDETNKDIANMERKNEKVKKKNEMIEKIEDEIKTVKQELAQKERIKKGKAKNNGKEKKVEDVEEITKENAREKIKNAGKRLKKEKERLQEIIDHLRNLEKDLNSSGKDKYLEFRSGFERETSNIEEMVEENLYEVKQINEKIKDTLQSIELENGSGTKQEELRERNNKLNKLKYGIKMINNDLEALNEFEKNGVVKELDDSDIEELAYKIEAIQVSLDRMNKTIEEHLKEDGDPKVLETLIRRKTKMGESLDEANNEMENRKKNLQQDLRDLMNEKIRTEKEMNDMLGNGEIANEGEKEVILEMLKIDDIGQEISSDKVDNDLKSWIKQRDKIADEYEDFNRQGHLTEQDGDFLIRMVASIEQDIKERLDEMSEANKEKADDLGSNKAFIKEVLSNQSELESALSYLRKINAKRQHVEAENGKEESRHEESYSGSFDDLKMLAHNKIDAINEKLTNLDWFCEKLKARQSPDQELQTKGRDKRVKGKDDELLRGVKNELESLKTVEKDSDILHLLTAKTLDEMRAQKDSNNLLNQLCDERDLAIDHFIGRRTERDSAEKNSQDENAAEQIIELDRQILAHDVERIHYEPDTPLAQSSPAFQSGEREQEGFNKQGDIVLNSLLADRNLVLRKLFGAKTRETAQGYSDAEKQVIDEVSTLESELEKKLEALEANILQYGSPKSPEFERRTQSPNFYTMMSEIDNEIEILRTEIEEGKLFISGKDDLKGIGNEAQFESISGKGEDIQGEKHAELRDDKSIEEDISNLKETLEILEEKRTEVLLAVDDDDYDDDDNDRERSGNRNGLEDENELINKRNDLNKTRNDLEEKLEILKDRQDIENQISKIETNHFPTANESKSSSEEIISKLEDETKVLEKNLRDVDSNIAKFAIAIEKEIDGGRKENPKSDKLSLEDLEHVEIILKEKLNELMEERMKLERIKGNMERNQTDQGKLRDLVTKRKDIIEKLNKVSDQLDDKKLDEDLGNEFKVKRNKYKDEATNMRLLERKKHELEQYLKELELENELSTEDATSGFSDTSLENKEKEYLNVIEKQGNKIKELNELIKALTLEKDRIKNEINEEKDKVTDLEGRLTESENGLEEKQRELIELETELGEKDDLISQKEEEALMLRNEINELNEASEAMLEVANAMDEQNQSKSIEIELNYDKIRDLENRLKKMEKESEKDVGKSDNIELKSENHRLCSENTDLNKELESLKDEMKGLENKLDEEKMHCQKLENEMKMLEKLKEELKSKGKKTLKVEVEDLQSTVDSGSFDNEEDSKGAGNDLKYEIDKVTAIDEIMKLAAELIAENERKASNCKDLEAQKDDLTRILEELLDKCQTQKEQIENMQKELEGKDQLNDSLKDEREEMSNKVSETLKESQDVRRRFEEHQKRNQDMKQEIDELQNKNHELQNERNKQNDEISRLHAEIAELKRLLEEIQLIGVAPTIAEIGPKIEEENFVAIEDRSLMYEPDDDTRQFEDEIIDLTNRINELSKENDELRLKEEIIEKKLQETEDGLESEKDCLKLAESEIEELMGRIRAMHDDIKGLKNNIANEKLEREKAENIAKQLRDNLDEKEQIITEYEMINLQLKNEIKDLKMEKQQSEHEMSLAAKRNDILQNQIDGLENEKMQILENMKEIKKNLEEQQHLMFEEKQNFDKDKNKQLTEIARLKNDFDVLKFENAQIKASNERKMKKLVTELEEEKRSYEVLEKNFERMKSAKENIIKDYDKQLNSLQDEINSLKKLQKSSEDKLRKEREQNGFLSDKFTELGEKLSGEKKEAIESITEETKKEIEKKGDEIRRAEKNLQDKAFEVENLKKIIGKFEKEREIENENWEEEKQRLKGEIKKKEEIIRKLKSVGETFDEEMNQGVEEIEMLRNDLEEKIKERNAMNDKYHRLMEKLDEKDDEMMKKVTDLRNEMQGMKKDLLGKSHEIENEKMKSKLTGIEMAKYKKQLVEETMDNREREDKIAKERDILKENVKNCEQIIGQLKERNSVETRSRDIRIEDLEEENENLQNKMKKIQEKLMKELDKKETLESVENENNILKNQVENYKERMIDITENYVQKGKAEKLKNELIKIKEEYEKLKNESINIVKYSNTMKTDLRKLKTQLAEKTSEHKKEQKFLIENLETEFRKRIEEMIRNNLQEKENILKMWDEEREHWETELKEQLDNSKEESSRKLNEQRIDLEKENMKKLSKVITENDIVVNELNERLNELENERSKIERKFDDEMRSTESQFIVEKEYMVTMIRELLRNIIDGKTRKHVMKRSHNYELTDIEEKYEHDKNYMDMRLKQELQMLREKVKNLLSREVPTFDLNPEILDHDETTSLDVIPRKLT